MGTEIPPPYVPPPTSAGTYCSTCWGPVNILGPAPTPRQVVLVYSGFEKGVDWVPRDGDPPDGEYTLWQSGFTACTWSQLYGDNNFGLYFTFAGTTLRIIRFGGYDVFRMVNPGQCLLFLPNTIDKHFKNGSVQIILPEVV